jgi:hypothetical protein
MELSPSWEATSRSPTQRVSQHFMEPAGSLSCSQKSSSGPYPKPDQSSIQHPTLFIQDPF